jgi:hypothetical protein
MEVNQAKATSFQQCKAIKKNGEPCTARAVVDGFCVGHSPNAIEARRKGGRNRSNVARLNKMIPTRLKPTLDLIEKAIKEVHEGELQPQKGTAMASLAGAMIKVFETGVLEERLLKLENLAKERGETR